MNQEEFSAAMREAETEAGVSAEVDPILGSNAVPPPDIDADQRTTPDDEGHPAAADEQAAETPRDASAERLYAGRYKSVEELERAVEEQRAFIDRQGTDVGQLRQQVDHLAQLVQQQAQPALAENLDAVYDNPMLGQQLAYQALQRGDMAAYDRALTAWEEVDRAGARAYDRQVQAWLIQQQVAPQVQTAQQVAARQADADALNAAASRHPDFQQVMGTLTEQRLQQMVNDPAFPVTQEMLAATDATTKLKVYEAVYRWQKAEQADLLARANAQATAETEEAARQDKAQAQVASATRAAATSGALTEEDRLAELAAASNRTWRR